jgi:hypothetical protein
MSVVLYSTFSLDLSISAIESALAPLGDHLSCGLCQAALSERIKVLTTRWSRIKVRWQFQFFSASFIIGDKEIDLSFTVGSLPLHIYLPNYISNLLVKPRSP